MAEQVNLEGTDWISNIPGIYFDAVGQLIKRLGNPQAGAYIGKIALGVIGV